MSTHVSSGGVVWRIVDNRLQVLIMHRMQTNSWHLPKGTKNPGESDEDAAEREIKEETGLEVSLGHYLGNLPSTFERGGRHIQKRTHYFLATEVGGALSQHDHEHDRVEYIDAADAIRLLREHTLYEQEWLMVEQAADELLNTDDV